METTNSDKNLNVTVGRAETTAPKKNKPDH